MQVVITLVVLGIVIYVVVTVVIPALQSLGPPPIPPPLPPTPPTPSPSPTPAPTPAPPLPDFSTWANAATTQLQNMIATATPNDCQAMHDLYYQICTQFLGYTEAERDVGGGVNNNLVEEMENFRKKMRNLDCPYSLIPPTSCH